MTQVVRRSSHVMVFLMSAALIACARPVSGRYYEETVGAPTVPVATPGGPTVSAIQQTPVTTEAPPTTPSPAYPGAYQGEPTPNPTPIGYSTRSSSATYVVNRGETLLYIAGLFGCTVDELVSANDLASPDALQAGQTLLIPVSVTHTSPDLKLVPDSEVVYGPAYIHFDLAAFVAGQGGYLDSYSEQVEGRLLTGSEILHLISQRFSVGPRVLLTILEMRSGWVSEANPSQESLYTPIGNVGYGQSLYYQLSWAAGQLNQGYYGWKLGVDDAFRLQDGTRVGVAPTLNPGTASVQTCLAGLSADWDQFERQVGADGFLLTYQRLFGSPFAYAVEPLFPEGLQQPELLLPWEKGYTWYYTGGPHGGWGDDPANAAVDFVPSEQMLGCTPSSEWVTAAASGVVVRSEDGQVVLDLDGDGFEQSGWVLFYLHIYENGRVKEGTYLEQGDRIGRPSCEGGYSEATHVHFARRYNGEWVPAGAGSLPMVLSGWTVENGDRPYDGTMVKAGQVRTACECWEDGINGLLSDNG
ncbi:MAG: LysM peptidoglycan-binding domain-containing protein [Chloroflexi bacterium]|nr:LysM peptidoglycan-binding domain-containing protein [Chloroflexota bacterium]